MDLLVVLLIILLIFGGGWGYYGSRRGTGLGGGWGIPGILIAIVLLALLLRLLRVY